MRLGGPAASRNSWMTAEPRSPRTPDMRMLGGGQPAAIPQVQQLWRERMRAMLDDGSIDRTLLNYDPPGGNPLFREAFAAFLKRECGWNVTRENIAVMPSSQSACFLLFNLLAGQTGSAKSAAFSSRCCPNTSATPIRRSRRPVHRLPAAHRRNRAA
jgi:valine--pyruvate aminotransferase